MKQKLGRFLCEMSAEVDELGTEWPQIFSGLIDSFTLNRVDY